MLCTPTLSSAAIQAHSNMHGQTLNGTGRSSLHRPPKTRAALCRIRSLQGRRATHAVFTAHAAASPAEALPVKEQPTVASGSVQAQQQAAVPVLQLGDIVTGEVVFVNLKGARVRLLGPHDGVIGYMPARHNPTIPLPVAPSHAAAGIAETAHTDSDIKIQLPVELEDAQPNETGHFSVSYQQQNQSEQHQQQLADPAAEVLPVGHTRSFVVVSCGEGGRGPLLSVSQFDQQLRLQRMIDLQGRERRSCSLSGGNELERLEYYWKPHTVWAKVLAANKGGCICSLNGYNQAFLPAREIACTTSRLQRSGAERIQEALVGKWIQVVVIDVDVDLRKVVVSEKESILLRLPGWFREGAMLKGKVREVSDGRLQIDLAGILSPELVQCSLPASQVTQDTGISQEEVLASFEPGDDVRAVVWRASVPPHSRALLRVTLTMRQLEQQVGEMAQREARAQRWSQMDEMANERARHHDHMRAIQKKHGQYLLSYEQLLDLEAAS